MNPTMPWVFDDGGRAGAGFRGHAQDCVCRAIAIATGHDYRAIYDALNGAEAAKTRWTRQRGSARTGITKDVERPFLRNIGWTWQPTMYIGVGCTVHLRAGELPPVGRLVVACSRHLTAVIDGVIHDTHDPSRAGTRCCYGFYYRAEDTRVATWVTHFQKRNIRRRR
jgi:hypothetical protein